MKKTKILASMLVLAATCSGAYADNYARQTIQAYLPAYVNIKVEDCMLKSNINAETGNLTEAFNSVFKISSNDNIDLYLRAETMAENVGAVNGFYKKNGTVYIILGHTGVRPTATAIENIRQGNTDPEQNQNAIAYPVSSVKLTGNFTKEPVFVDDKARYEFSVKQGETTATTTISANVDKTTYSYNDKSGNYEAYIILTDTTT